RSADGLLSAEEVASLDLRGSELVVLSACETGLGQVAGGEGVLGLQRAFQTAGARTLVTSLWSINDAATALLMAELYRNLWQKRMPRLAALREAQRALLRAGRAEGAEGLVLDDEPGEGRNAAPAAWAGLVLSGDWR